tara:strand:+ start:4704 stop:5111 length:408 start_codon:yes stop_codon:yes gene_type:complete
MQNLKMITCPKCGDDFPELRKTTYGYNFCVNCSDVEGVVGVTTVEGSGDHTYNGLIIMDRKQYQAIAQHEAEVMGRKSPIQAEILDMDRDENEVSQSIKEKVHNILDEDETKPVKKSVDEPDDEDKTMMVKGIDY